MTSAATSRDPRIVNAGGTTTDWRDHLPRKSSGELAREERERQARHRLAGLPTDFLAHVEESLQRWWPIQRHTNGRLELTVIQPDGQRHAFTSRASHLLLGRGADCGLRLPSPSVRAEHCELTLAEGRAEVVALHGGVQHNGRPLEPGRPSLLELDDVLDLAPFRLLVSGVHFDEESGETRITPRGLTLYDGSDPLAAAAPSGSPWLEVRCGDWRGFLSLPLGWLALAYRALGYPPPRDAGQTLLNEVDAALTSFLLRRTAATLGERAGRTVEVTGPLTARQAATFLTRLTGTSTLDAPTAGVPPVIDLGSSAGQHSTPACWTFASFDVELAGTSRQCTVVWSADPQPDTETAAPPLGHCTLPVSIHCGWTTLGTRDLAGLETGDVLLPDRWYPDPSIFDPGRASESPASATGARLILQGFARPARLTLDGDRFQLELAAPWTATPPGGALMTDQLIPDEQPSETTPSETTGGPPLPGELEVLVSFELDRLPVTLDELGRWREGTTLRLDSGPSDPVRILLQQGAGHVLLGYGRVIVVDERLGIQIERWSDRSREGS